MKKQMRKYPEDFETYKQFLERCKNRSLRKDDPVIGMVTRKAYKTASSWNWSDWVEDLIQDTYMGLSKGGYRGDGPLEAYVGSIMGTQVKQYWRKERRDLRDEMPEESLVPSELSFPAELELSDLIKRIIAKTPQQLWWYIEFIVEYEDYASERDAAEYGNVTRHQIKKIKEQIKRICIAEGLAKATSGGD